MEFLIQMEVGPVAGGTEDEQSLRQREGQRAGELAASGILVRLWRVPGERANWGIWRADNASELHEALSSLPLYPYLKIKVHPLAAHPNDPGPQASLSSQSRTGIPGLRGTDHIGITVPNLEAAVSFFCEVIGYTAFYDVGPIEFADDWMQTHLNVHPRARINKLRFLRCGHGSNLELFEYASPDQRTELPKNSDYGGNHLAYYVDDFDAALRYLKDKSVRILGEPTVREGGPNGGLTWVYFLAPWGLQMELVSFPKGKGYEKTQPDRLWHPAFPAQ
jgi:muconolactone delta-isomerase